jgi:hypothetical protein
MTSGFFCKYETTFSKLGTLALLVWVCPPKYFSETMLTILKVFALADEVRRLEREVEKLKRDGRPA